MKTFSQSSPCRATRNFSSCHFCRITKYIYFCVAISSDYDFEHDIYIVGGQLDITGNLTFPSHRKIVVWENGTLNINGATLNNARIVVKPGGKVNITNGATINLRDTKSLVVPTGARLNISQGVIK